MPRRSDVPLAAALFALLCAGPVAAAFDPAAHHAANCTSCHDDSVYTRDNRMVNSLPALEAQVARCEANLSTGLFPEEQAAVVEYLNRKYYKFARN
jgi:hypothetical protein